MTDNTMPDRITAWAWEVNPNMGQWETAQSIVGEGAEYLALHGETLGEVRAALALLTDRSRTLVFAHHHGNGLEGWHNTVDGVDRAITVARAALAKIGGTNG
ncbi:hypothetical protein [Neotabrizicola sp. VNH66]|uniref:hypothetical protein n=1 Tax=Neotabrizicola sp. VNH66 TaxID=3400918 RepID=UPI003C03F956